MRSSWHRCHFWVRRSPFLLPGEVIYAEHFHKSVTCVSRSRKNIDDANTRWIDIAFAESMFAMKSSVSECVVAHWVNFSSLSASGTSSSFVMSNTAPSSFTVRSAFWLHCLQFLNGCLDFGTGVPTSQVVLLSTHEAPSHALYRNKVLIDDVSVFRTDTRELDGKHLAPWIYTVLSIWSLRHHSYDQASTSTRPPEPHTLSERGES